MSDVPSMNPDVSNPFAIVEELYKEYAADVFNFLVYYTSDRMAAEDLLQETFLRVLKSHGKAIHQLPAKYRLVVLLRAMEGFSIAETSGILGWSESKVKTTYHRALKRLALYLEEKGVGKDDEP